MSEKICSTTGHRPSKLSWGYNEDSYECIDFKSKIKNLLESFIEKGYTHFISGMALGTDMIFAETIIELTKTIPSH